jgi:hypothetical protein
MKKELHITMKVWKPTLKKLRILHAELDMPIVAILDKLVDQELARIKREGENASEN